MTWMSYCPVVGGACNKPEPEISIQQDTFFLAEPFTPEEEKKRRECAVKGALRDSLKGQFSETILRVADKEPKDPAIFCDICRMIQSSAYGIVDVSGLNSNALLELGMMFALGKPVFILVKKSEQDSLKEKLPSDIIWKRVIPYEEFIDIIEELSNQIKNRPRIEPRPSLGEKAKEAFAKLDPSFAQTIDAKLQEIRQEQNKALERMENLLKEAKLGEAISQKTTPVISPSVEKQIEELRKKAVSIDELVGVREDFESVFLKGNWLMHKGKHREALELYDRALTLKPDSAEAWNSKGIALQNLGRHEEAITCYDRAIEINPKEETAWINKGNSLDELGRHEEAIGCYDKAAEINPKKLDVWVNKGVALSNLGRHEEAITCYDKAIEINPKEETAWNNKGAVLRRLGKYEEAIACNNKAIEINPKEETAWNNKGDVFAHLGRWEEAKHCYEEALKIKPEYVSALNNLAEAFLALGDTDRSLSIAERVFNLPEDATDAETKIVSWFLRISAYFLKGEPEKARKEKESLIVYRKGLKKGAKVTRWDFSTLLPTIESKLEGENKQELLSLISLLKTEPGSPNTD